MSKKIEKGSVAILLCKQNIYHHSRFWHVFHEILATQIYNRRNVVLWTYNLWSRVTVILNIQTICRWWDFLPHEGSSACLHHMKKPNNKVSYQISSCLLANTLDPPNKEKVGKEGSDAEWLVTGVHFSLDVLPSWADRGSCAHKCVC